MCLLPSEQAPQDSVALGSSGLSRIGSIVPSEAQCREMLVVRGFVYWQDNRLEQDLKDGHYAVVPPEAVPWQDVLDLCSGHDHSTGGSEIWTCKSIGIGCWEECHRRAGLPSAKATGESSLSLADLALLEWGKFFA